MNVPDTVPACRDGFEWVPIEKRCMDIDECATMNGGCAHSCQNTKGSFQCECITGYTLGGDGKSCIDTMIVPNTTPACKAGFEWIPIEKRCMDIDECAMKLDGCTYTCMNTKGSYLCGCNPGYTLDGVGHCIATAIYNTGSQEHAVNQVCGTESKCGIEGGFCIPGNETCNGKTITEEGYCNANYDKQINHMGCKCCLKPTVYMRDIENTIAYALRNRAPYNIDGPPTQNGSAFRTLNTTEQEVLSNFTKALVNHLPLRDPVKIFLICLSQQLASLDGKSITGQELVNITYKYCTSLRGGELPNIREWVGCKNFDMPWAQQFRSYPCGVWITFHAMTANLKQGHPEDARRMLPTLYGMVDYFPWCKECKGNFTDMYGKDKAGKMDTADEVTMWLWFAHNKVSHRAPNTFEPNRPRSLFPNDKVCPDCWISYTGNYSSSIANSNNVLSYLRDLYKWNNIV